MKKFLIMPERGILYTVESMTAEAAYRDECCWFPAEKRIGIMDIETGHTDFFWRELDGAGNLVKIRKGGFEA